MKSTTCTLVLILLIANLSLSAQSRDGFNLVWEDNFDGNRLDSSSWTHETAEPGWVNNELQRYTNDNIELRDGSLVIIAKHENNEYTSARLITRGKRTFTYGLVEIRAKLPVGKGTWPALWMLGQNIEEVSWPACGELDIMEHVGKNPGFIHSSIHNPSGYGATPYTGIIQIEDPFNTFHIYGMNWTKDFVDFYTDGELVYHYQPETKNAENWPFDKPCYFIFNIAIGGNWGGPEVDQKIFPATMSVDWIKVYQK